MELMKSISEMAAKSQSVGQSVILTTTAATAATTPTTSSVNKTVIAQLVEKAKHCAGKRNVSSLETYLI